MSLETKIEELKVAIVALTAAVGALQTQEKPAAPVSAKEEPKSTTRPAKKEVVEDAEFEEVPKKAAPKAEAKPAEKPAAPKNAAPKVEPEEESDEGGLPAGERDAAYFNTHLRPLCVDLLDTHGDAMKKLAVKCGVDRLSNADPKHWDGIYKRLKVMTEEAAAAAAAKAAADAAAAKAAADVDAFDDEDGI